MKYRKKPIIINAIQWTGDNQDEITVFTGTNELAVGFIDNEIEIETLEGVMRASENDYIIKGIKGEFYPCKPDIFKMTYEQVEKGW